MQKKPALLVVDDDPSIRRLAKRMIGPLGFDILESSTGQEALNRLADDTSAVSAMLTDMNLPDINGDCLCERVRELSPGLPVVFFSGAPLSESAKQQLRSPNTYHLPKPFSKESLESVFHQIL